MRQITSYILTALLLLALGSCQSDRLEPKATESSTAGDRTMILTVEAPDTDPSLRAHLSGEAGDPVLKATFEETDNVALFIWQDGKLYDLANVRFASIEEGGKRATLTFELPEGVDETKAINLIGYDGPTAFGYKSGDVVKRDRMKIEGDQIIISGRPYGPTELSNFKAPVMLHANGIIPSEAERTNRVVRFEHFGCYEVIFFTNNSTESFRPRAGLSAKGRSNYGPTRTWAYTMGFDRELGEMAYPFIDLTKGELFYSGAKEPNQAYASTKPLDPGATVALVSWYVPNTEVNIPELKLVSQHSYKWIASDQTIPAKDFPMEIGKAYAVYASWDGTKVTLGKMEIIEPTAIKLDQDKMTLGVGETATLKATIEPEEATNKNVTWSSSDDTIVTVEDGVVTGKKVGTVTITAETSNGLKATAEVIVKEIAVTKVTLSETTATMTIGGELKLTATIEPADATNKRLTWSSSDTGVATVDSDGKVTAKAAGTTTITATAASGITAACEITVSEEVIEVTGVTLDKTEATVQVGKTIDLVATVEPAGATHPQLEWTSSDSTIATVTDGRVTGFAPGKVTITVKTANGKTASCTVTVEKVKGVPDVPGVEL